jgi:hypothetical protein
MRDGAYFENVLDDPSTDPDTACALCHEIGRTLVTVIVHDGGMLVCYRCITEGMN